MISYLLKREFCTKLCNINNKKLFVTLNINIRFVLLASIDIQTNALFLIITPS